ncbi:VanZ family protein [Kocuria rhizophila]|uniref:VanZ family protein n=1 Tax=Kocuria rhizophila TaxID=72000 RepID=UPI00073D69EB|nr:VanZ family protein [Kocuria rhizophila]
MPRLLGALAVSLYAAGLFAYTLLPLPVPAELDCTGGSQVQLRSFQFLADIGHETAGLSVTGMLTARVTLQVVFNVVLFLPWGLLVRGFFKRGWVLATVTGFLGSLLIEVTQYTGPWFLYPCSYRLADVDDLIMNTLGGLLGALLAPLVRHAAGLARPGGAPHRGHRGVGDAGARHGLAAARPHRGGARHGAAAGSAVDRGPGAVRDPGGHEKSPPP